MAAGQPARVSEERRDEAGAALWKARLAATEASCAEYREAARWLARSNAELLRRQQGAEREAATVVAFLTKQGQKAAEEVCAAPGRPPLFPPGLQIQLPGARPPVATRPASRSRAEGPAAPGAAARPGGGTAPRGLGWAGLGLLPHFGNAAASGLSPLPQCKRRIKTLKQELIDLKQQVQEEKQQLVNELFVLRTIFSSVCSMLYDMMFGDWFHFAFSLLRISDLQAHYYAQQIKELEEKFQKKVEEVGQIKLQLKLINKFHREKAAVEKELEDKRREDAEKKQKMMTEAAQHEAVLQLNSTGREVFKENVCLHDAFAHQLKETMELQKTKHQLEEDKTLLLQEKETSEGLIRKKNLQINHQKAQIGDLQRRVEELEMALRRLTRESDQETQHQALRESQASVVEVKKLQQLLEMKDREMKRVKKLAQNILNERTEVERFFLDALEHVKQEIISSRKHYKKKAQTAYYRKMMAACAGMEAFPQVKTFKSNVNSTNSVYRDLEEAEKCYWEKIQFEKVDISELTWEQKERVLRLLFAKMNGTNPRKYKRVLANSAPAPDNTEETKIG
ncbi:basal body-orientation factor 1 [Porphyrio hochstetteri]